MTDFKTIHDIQQIQQLLGSEQLLALTAPLILDKMVMVGFYSTSGGQGCMEIPKLESNPLAKLLFQPTHTRIVVHGLKRIWGTLQAWEIGTSELNLDLVTDKAYGLFAQS